MAELKYTNVEELAYAGVKRTAEVTRKLNLREEPSKESEIVKIMNKGEKVQVVWEGDEWAATTEGFCMKEFLN